MRTPHRVGVYLGAVQFLFALTWVVYVIYLPQLAAKAGLGKEAVVWILVLDQMIFAVMDALTGIAADRVARSVGRLGALVVALTLVSCAAFVALPYVAPAADPKVFLALTILWSLTSSALRAPPLVLIGRYAPQPSHPWLASLTLLGLGIAAGLAPFLALKLKGVDPALPFVVSTLALAATALGIVWAERALAGRFAAPAAATARPPRLGGRAAAFLAAIVLLAAGFQIHFQLNSAPQYLQFAKPEDLPYLMPIFWVGFNLCMLPASLATRRWGGIVVMAAAGVAGAIALYGASVAARLDMLAAAQFLAGGAWGCVLMSAVSAALAFGHTGREGSVTGALFALLAVATLARLAFVAAGLGAVPGVAAVLGWLPVVAWLAAGALLLVAAGSARAAPSRAGAA